MAWEWNLIISLLYWTILFPFETHGTSDRLNTWLGFMDHITPLGYVTIDWFLNGMQYEKTSIIPNMVVATAYGIFNIIFTKVTGSPVYPPLITWDSPVSWTVGFSIIPLFAGAFYLELWFTNIKMRRVH
jgi:hypothetical protein